MIQLSNIEKTYKSGGKEQTILKHLSLEIKAGEFVLIMGKSGSGKSTLLNLISGVDSADKGKIKIANDSIDNLTEEQLSKWRGKNLGIIFQFFQLIPTLSVLENILLPMDLVNIVPPGQRLAKAKALLQTVGMYAHAGKMPSGLSGGEQQRVAIARALANDVDLIVADEPTGNLDSKNSEMIFQLLRELRRQGKTIVMVTHEKEIIKGASRKIVLMDGEVIEDINLLEGTEGQ